MENGNQYPVMLKNCTEVHIGPRIEINFEEPNASRLKKEDEESNEMFNSCCHMLKNKYKTYFSYMRSYLWEGKRNDFPLKDYFIELRVEKADLFGKKSGEKISLNEIFSIKQDGHQTILVTGDPGYGKTTICKKIVYDWATTNYLKHFDLTFIVILRELGDRSVKDALLDNMHVYSSINKDWKFQDRQRNILVILDGLDEIVDKSKILKFIREESFFISRRTTIVVSSRPEAAEDIREDMNMRFSIEGFSPEYQEKYIQLMFREDKSKAYILYSVLKENEFYSKMAECPLMLHMFCCLHQNGKITEIEKMTDLYIQIFSLITERYVRKTNQQNKFKRGKFFVGENLLMKLGEVHFITSERLRNYFPNEDEYNFIIGLDILTLDSFSECDNIIRYRFVHRTFAEFLSALSMYVSFQSTNLCMISPANSIIGMKFLFLLGFYKDEPLPERFLTYVEKEMFKPQFMLEVHKQMKLRTNWKQFCSHAKVIFYSWKDRRSLEELLKFCKLKEIYFYFLERDSGRFEDHNYSIYYLIKDSLQHSMKIYLILSLERLPRENIYDIRGPISRILELYYEMDTSNVDVFLIGVSKPLDDSFDTFTNVNFNLNLSDDMRKLLKVSKREKLVALETGDELKVTGSYILSLKQYESIRRHILCKSASKHNSKCVMM
ncbi:NACHT, LRR and PYD domains-containing protein 10-like [Centruroides sculpturatus]|uniref:NACHT, LRR and PYD domains-containing protein 10-like n=1 Tax=Centruroides sculpturatus TaxID=218467 RepID=UPI000C6C9674|nr:NACHT, LRR and PYD domains-containing protein 10-like [Centruroides sculpturatus]